ncbi:GNAT family N-acetyltransferase [Chengkuizengella marina]|uniref:GNAT family N-acetyltransferase n=1 Tax=Chengkuizengella marina TaxID=2507566 RepID=A0A6N9Q8R0_9BACL|nr:GNAT family N-acetyltransferase [Chengkuizengella marina]NBI31110.1 GNAT family N-acetyltransferase [Chengkuizengella marina]
MVIQKKVVHGKSLTWILRCPIKKDAEELSKLRIQIDGETDNLDREAGEGILTTKDFEKLIYDDTVAEKNLFLVAEVQGKIVGFTRCEGNNLSRFRHKAEFGIGILKEYWGFGIGKILLENILLWADSTEIQKIYLSVVETNTNAIQLYKKVGFKVEGILKQDRIHKNGQFYNTVIMGRFKIL